jgi:TPR repeat protein
MKHAGWLWVSFSLVFGCVPHPRVDVPGPDEPLPLPAGGYQEPLVVDWRPEHRTDLEVVMRSNVAVVGLRDGKLKLLKNCSIEDTYAYVGVNRKEEVVRFETSHEIQANLPLAASAFGAKLEGEVKSGRTLDLGLVIVGKRTTVRSQAVLADLRGDCTGASHFVRAATVGAFALKTGKRGSARTVAELFGAGVSASAQSSREFSTQDGEMASCAATDLTAESPPTRCSALLRVELLPILKERPKSSEPGTATPTCAPGMVWDGDKCAAASRTQRHTCKPSDLADCNEQCARGDGQSCFNAAKFYRNGDGVPIDVKHHYSLQQRACELGSMRGCAAAGVQHLYGLGEAPRDYDKARALFAKSCDAGEGHGCANLGVVHRDGRGVPVDVQKARALMQRACDSGYANGCSLLGQLHRGMLGAPDFKQAFALLEKACKAGGPDGCNNLGTLYETGHGAKKDEFRAVQLFRQGCDMGGGFSCSSLGRMLESGRGIPKNEAEAVKFYQRACDSSVTCTHIGRVYSQGIGVTKDPQKARELLEKGCNFGEGYACMQLGFLYGSGGLGTADPVRAITYYEKGCDEGSGYACTMAAAQYHKGNGVAKNATQAVGLDVRGCDLGDAEACQGAAYSFTHGEGVPVDYQRALQLYQKGCDLGAAVACGNLGSAHALGRGVPVDKAKANALYTQSCDMGGAKACANMGKKYLWGDGVPKDVERGYRLLHKSCDLGDSDACLTAGRSKVNLPDRVTEGLELLRRGCTLKLASACQELANAYRNGAGGLAVDVTSANEYQKQACGFDPQLHACAPVR